MCSLRGFHPLPNPGCITLCEVDGVPKSMMLDKANISNYTSSVNCHPKVVISRELLHSSTSCEDVRQCFLPVPESFFKRWITTWYEQGLTDALIMATDSSQQPPFLFKLVATNILKLKNGVTRIRNIFYPHLMEQGKKLIAAVSQTREFDHSPIRCLSWHPNCTKIAAVTWDDSVRIYNTDSMLLPILKSKFQRLVSCIAWRPYSASEIAVGCEKGVLVWFVDPNSQVTRPSISNATILKCAGHSPVTSVCWKPQGDLLISASAADRNMFVWDVSMERSVPLGRIAGGGVSLVSWSPEGTKVFAATTGTIFRVWETSTWTPERWSLLSGRVHSACWSPCGTVVLFTTSEEAVVFSLTFQAASSVFINDCRDISKTAVRLIDLNSILLDNGSRVGGIVSSMIWDGRGRYLAIMFHDSDIIAVYNTHLNETNILVSPCCFINGMPSEGPSTMCFQKNFSEGSLLTIAWTSGRVQHFPFITSGSSTMYNEDLFPHSLPSF